MKIRTEKISSVGDLILKLKKLPARHTWFRGHSASNWTLLPNILRGGYTQQREKDLLRKFQQHSISFLSPRPATEWEWLFLMQHFGVPTRLLDWSESPLVALYFSIYGMHTEIKKGDGAIWTLNSSEFNKASKLDYIPAFGLDEYMESFLVNNLEMPPVKQAVAVLAQRQFPRLIAQQGTFVIFHKENKGLEEMANADTCLTKIVVPASKKKKLADELRSIGIDRMSLFPELENVAQRLRA